MKNPQEVFFFQCDNSGLITTPANEQLEPLYVPWARDDDSHIDDENLQKLKGSTLFKIFYPDQQFYFKKDNAIFELRVMNPIEFEGFLTLKKTDLEAQYPHCGSAVKVCMFAQFLDKKVSAVTNKSNGDLFIDFDNKTTLVCVGDPALDGFDDDNLWELIDTRTGDRLSMHFEGKVKEAEIAKRTKVEISENQLLVHLEEQVRLQNLILKSFNQKFPELEDSNDIERFPNRGQIECAGISWEFRKAGPGYVFEEQGWGRKLDLRSEFQNPNLFNSCRVHCYLNSVLKDQRIERMDITHLLGRICRNKKTPVNRYKEWYIWGEGLEESEFKGQEFKVSVKKPKP